MPLIIEMTQFNCNRCADRNYVFLKRKEELLSIKCICCGYYPFNTGKNLELGQFLEQNT